MSGCCSPSGYRWVFSEKRAQADAKRYRRRARDPTSRRIVVIAKQQALGGRTLLEIGGGVGAIQIELLRAGISKAVSVELTPIFERVAGALLHETCRGAKVRPPLGGLALPSQVQSRRI